MNKHMVKLWIMDQITKITKKKQVGYLSPEVADGKIDILRDFYDTFDLKDSNINITYHDQI